MRSPARFHRLTRVLGAATFAAAALAGAAVVGDVATASAAPRVLTEGFESPSRWSDRLSRRDSQRAAIVPAPGRPGRALRVRYPAADIGGGAGVQFELPLRRRGDDLHLRYRVRFQRGFDFVLAGKLPGLAGGDANSGGDVPNGSDGWSGRLQWLQGGRVENYMYLPTSDGFGTHFPWRGRLSRGSWNCLEMRYRLNTPGRSNGRIMSWLNGRPVLDRSGLRFRDTRSLRIDQVYFSTFFGGNTDDYAPERAQFAWFDDFVVSTGRIGCRA